MRRLRALGERGSGGGEPGRIAEALRETRERYGRLVETAHDVIYTHDLEGRIRSLNRAAERLTGYRREEVEGRNIAEFVAPDHRGLVRRMIERKVKEGGWTTYEVEILTRDGRRIPVEVSTQLIRERGRPVGVQGIARDITERRRVEQERARRLESEREARARAEAGQRRWRFLAEAGNLLASSLDYETTLKTIARLAIPTLADYVTVDMRGDDGVVRRVETAHVDPEKERIAWEIARRYPPYASRRSAVAQSLREARAILIDEVSDGYLKRLAADEHHLRLLRRLGMRSGIAAPLVAHERTLGSLTFVITESDRRYGGEDLAFAQALADRAALAAD
ncbi:MAG: PAS domain S-box protein, partial [Gemmatimonadota bacterium]